MDNNQKNNYYQSLLTETKYILGYDGKYTPGTIGKMAISTALLSRHIPDLVFAGYYLLSGSQLEIGPYQGNIIACTPIQLGKGVRGTCAENQKTIIVEDVNLYPNYIACDTETNSEIVLPVFVNNKFSGVLDIDGKNIGQFDETDVENLEHFLNLIFSRH